MIRPAVFLATILAVLNTVHGLSCPPCNVVDCRDPDDCKYGLAKDVCSCCNVCAKGPGEECGGMWRIKGTCAEGSTCDTSGSVDEHFYTGYPQEFLGGVCVAVNIPTKTHNLIKRPIGRPSGGGARSGLLGGGRGGKVKKLARKHKYQLFGSSIPPHIAAALRQQHKRVKRSDISFRRRAGMAKMTATKHGHHAYGGIPPEYLKLLKLYKKSKKRGGNRAKRAVGGGLLRRAGSAKLTAKKHKHTAYGGIPEKYAKLLKLG